MSTIYVMVGVELLSGDTSIGNTHEEQHDTPQDVFDSVLESNRIYIEEGLEGDEISGLPASPTNATSGSGVLIRDSYEHAVIWFPKPEKTLLFAEHSGILFSVDKERFRTFVHLWPHLLMRHTNGIHCVPDEALRRAIDGGVEIGTHLNAASALSFTRNDIDFLYHPLMGH